MVMIVNKVDILPVKPKFELSNQRISAGEQYLTQTNIKKGQQKQNY